METITRDQIINFIAHSFNLTNIGLIIGAIVTLIQTIAQTIDPLNHDQIVTNSIIILVSLLHYVLHLIQYIYHSFVHQSVNIVDHEVNIIHGMLSIAHLAIIIASPMSGFVPRTPDDETNLSFYRFYQCVFIYNIIHFVFHFAWIIYSKCASRFVNILPIADINVNN